MLDILQDYIASKGYSFGRIDGKITGRARQDMIDNYTSGNIFIMLLSTKAGGVV